MATLGTCVETLASGEQVSHGAKSSYSPWQSIKHELSQVARLGRFTVFVPDGASTFGASQAEMHGGQIQQGQNVVAHWNRWREAEGLTALEILHCIAHRGTLFGKDCRGAFTNKWHNI